MANQVTVLLKKLTLSRIWKRLLTERLNEPLHLNLMSLFVLLFGSFQAKAAWDLVFRPHNAFGILKAAEMAKDNGYSTVTLIEFGVASGAGLLNMVSIAQQVTRVTGVQFKLYGFDTGKGLPAPVDYRDYPAAFQGGDYPMNPEKIREKLPSWAQLVLGDVSQTIPDFVQHTLSSDAPLAYIVVDVDYYSSTCDALKVFEGPATSYLPIVTVYLDDIDEWGHNEFCGEIQAAKDFNASHDLRKIEYYRFLKSYRVFQRARWLDKVFKAHIFDHPAVQGKERTFVKTLQNPYLK